MPFKFVLVYFLTIPPFGTFAEECREVEGAPDFNDRPCSFRASATFGLSDFLRRAEMSMPDASSEPTGTPREGNIWSRLLFGESSSPESLFGSPIAGLLNNGDLSPYQASATASETTFSYRRSIYPGETSVSPSGIGANLLDAIFSISRHDDYKCVPRILCEAASGKIPGRDFSGRLSSFLGNMGVNTFGEWLSWIDLAETSPILNFARAIILGYSNRGDSYQCYRAFPRCPRDPYRLVNYLNNHNGGFFQFFNKVNLYRPTPHANTTYTKIGKHGDSFPKFGAAKIERDHSQDFKSKTPLWRVNGNGGEIVYWKDRRKDDADGVRFPNRHKSPDRSSWKENYKAVPVFQNVGPGAPNDRPLLFLDTTGH
ncbi:hypothetical protein KM043_000831 [Ampulex compressa]|nr:hypothetical protein KM043_000831 [Ampulex compressa]